MRKQILKHIICYLEWLQIFFSITIADFAEVFLNSSANTNDLLLKLIKNAIFNIKQANIIHKQTGDNRYPMFFTIRKRSYKCEKW